MTSAAILDPRDKSDVTLKFTAGLVLALPFTAVIENVPDIRNIRIKVQYTINASKCTRNFLIDNRCTPFNRFNIPTNKHN